MKAQGLRIRLIGCLLLGLALCFPAAAEESPTAPPANEAGTRISISPLIRLSEREEAQSDDSPLEDSQKGTVHVDVALTVHEETMEIVETPTRYTLKDGEYRYATVRVNNTSLSATAEREGVFTGDLAIGLNTLDSETYLGIRLEVRLKNAEEPLVSNREDVHTLDFDLVYVQDEPFIKTDGQAIPPFPPSYLELVITPQYTPGQSVIYPQIGEIHVL